MAAISVPEFCRRCQKFSPQAEFVGAGYGRYCWRCYEKHVRLMASTQNMRECCDCHTQLFGEEPGRGVACRLVPKDGVYQLLCDICYVRWLMLMPETLRGTPAGRAMNL